MNKTPYQLYAARSINNLHAVPVYYREKFENAFKKAPELIAESNGYLLYKEERK